MIIYRSVAVSLPLDVSKCGVTTSEVDWMSCYNHYVICMTWETQCIQYSGLCFRLGCCERPICKKLWNGAQCPCRNLVQLFLFHDPSLRVLYLTMPLAQHRSLVTDNHWSISGKQVVFTLSIDIGMYLKGPSKYSEKLARKLKHCIWSKTSIQTIEIDQGPKRIEEQSMIETKDWSRLQSMI